MTANLTLVTGAFFGLLAVVLGAFGAHALKKTLSTDQLHSFEVGVKYQMYHAIVLLAFGLHSDSVNSLVYWFFTLGIILFSFSIYGLVISDSKGKKLRFLGPITPLGGLHLVSGWLLVIINAF